MTTQTSLQRSAALAALSILAAAVVPLQAGELEPPGPPAPTMKTLVQVEPRTPLENDFDTLTPIVISSPGSYYLTEDVQAFSGAHGIEITASFVTLDLNGFSVIGNTEVGSQNGINCSVQRGIVIKNGTVRDFFNHGVQLNSCPGSRVERVAAHNNGLGGPGFNGFNLGRDSMVIESTASNNSHDGISTGTNNLVYHCIAVDNGHRGIDAAESVVEGCMAHGNIDDGIVTFNGVVKHSVAVDNADGISASNSLVQSNSAVSNAGNQITPDASSVQTENNE